jgi:hypothetical protein
VLAAEISAGWAALVVLALAGCGESAAVIEVRADDLAIPTQLSAFCLAVADRNGAGGEFARLYRFGDQIEGLPQTLTVEPGSADQAVAWARGYRAGIEVARDQASLGFDGVEDVTLSLARCPDGRSAAIATRGSFTLGGPGRIAASYGRGGTSIVAVGAGVAARLVVGDGGLIEAGGAPEPPIGPPAAIVAFDIDGDCDDDLAVIGEADPATLWRREPDGSFSPIGDGFAGGGPSGRAAAVADVDGDGDPDLVIGDATVLTLWRNDGAGRFTEDPGAIGADASDVTALGFGDFDGDGDADLLVGRGREAPAPVQVLFGDGGGALIQLEAAAPPIDLSVRQVAIRDLDGDRIDDAILAVAGDRLRIFASRGDGRLEDRSFLFFPDGPPEDSVAVAADDWNGDCLADAFVDGVPFRGSEAGMVVEEAPAIAASQILFVDVDDDGAAGAVMIDAAGEVRWLGR